MGEGYILESVTYKKKDILGLDIGTGLIKYVQLKNFKSLTKLVGYGQIKMPKEIIVEGVISEPEKLAKLIKEAIGSPPWGKITATQIVASLPESRLFTRTIEIPSVKESDIDEAIGYEIEQSVPIPASDLYTDWQIVGETKDSYLVFLAAAPRAIIDSYVQLIKHMGLEPIALEVSLAAITRAIIAEKEKELVSIVVDLGSQTTNMAVFNKNLQVAASTPQGAEIIKGSLMSVLNLDEKGANTQLLKGLQNKDKASEVIKLEINKIIEELERLVKYFQGKHEGLKIDQLLLCGGISSLKGLAEYIEEKTNIKTRVGNPWSNISVYPLKPVSKQESSLYSAAIGLCLRGLKDE